MTFLEAIIMKLTWETSNGGTCQLGDASITVRNNLDLWEWEYAGRTFWDVHDLAEAIIQGSKAFPTKSLSLPRKARAMRDTLKEESSPGAFFIESHERPEGDALISGLSNGPHQS